MARFVAQIFKTFGVFRPWTNVYFLDAVDLNAAITASFIILDAERVFHKNQVSFTKIRIADTNPVTDIFSIQPLSTSGTDGDVGEWLPLFNTARVDFGTSGFGRPSRKFYRLPLDEGDVNSGIIQSTLFTLISNTLVTLLDDMTANDSPLVDPDDQLLTTVAVKEDIQMRQLHRKRRRTPPPA